jgi:hypothetical protein
MMKNLVAVLLFTLLTAVCWGVYGPLVRWAQADLEKSHLMPFIGVGVAYFLIAVLAPGGWLQARGESGSWTLLGTIWSLAAGALGAIGALGIILALVNRGDPIYVMPLVFGTAPVVNTFTTMAMNRTYKEAGPLFFAGLILVITGAITVLIFKPSPTAAAASEGSLTMTEFALVGLFTGMTGLSWGAYGPVLHKGQSLMQGSRLRPLICVGLAYFLIAVLVPSALLATVGEAHGKFTISGGLWSLAAGSAGAIGALGVILAFTSGGKPIYVMPIVFGLAPIINTLVTMVTSKTLGSINPVFYAGLIIAAVGAVTVLVFAPKAPGHGPKHAPAPAAEPKPA